LQQLSQPPPPLDRTATTTSRLRSRRQCDNRALASAQAGTGANNVPVPQQPQHHQQQQQQQFNAVAPPSQLQQGVRQVAPQRHPSGLFLGDADELSRIVIAICSRPKRASATRKTGS
jgi:hypothetical protein